MDCFSSLGAFARIPGEIGSPFGSGRRKAALKVLPKLQTGEPSLGWRDRATTQLVGFLWRDYPLSAFGG